MSTIVKKGKALELAKEFSKKGDRILDAGCGNLFFLQELKKEGYENLHGVDVLDLPPDAQKDGILFSKANISEDPLPAPDGFFDCVCAWETVEHLENPFHFIREVRRVLKPGGMFLVSMPNPFHIMSKLVFFTGGNLPRWTRNNDHRAIFTKDLFWREFLKNHFDLAARRFWLGELGFYPIGFLYKPFRAIQKAIPWPENEMFGHFVVYIMRKKG